MSSILTPSFSLPSISRDAHKKPARRKKVIIIHPDLGIGGAERLILDAALALQSRGYSVTIYTSHRDRAHCFEEARDGTLDVRVRGNTVFPAHVAGRFHVLMATLRQLHLTVSVLRERGRVGNEKVANSQEAGVGVEKSNETGPEGKSEESDVDDEDQDDVFIVDQVPACVPVLKVFGSRISPLAGSTGIPRKRQRILFYCHFPDQLLARRDEGSWLFRMVKGWYRYPFDRFEGWAISQSDKVIANSKFTSGVVKKVFGNGLGEVGVVYPCVDTEDQPKIGEGGGEYGGGRLWGGLKIVLSINRFERKKDIGLAIRAYHGLGGDGRKGTRLVIAGGYDTRVSENVQYHRELDGLAMSLGLQTATSKTVISALSIPESIDVLFLLSVPSAFKKTLLSAATILVYTPSQEHFGIVPVEAMHTGLPVLAANSGGPLETIVDGETGWLRDGKAINQWTEVMRKALSQMDKREAATMSENGKLRVEKEFSRRAMGDRLEEEIQDMFNRERPPPIQIQPIFLGLAIVGITLPVLIPMIFKIL